MPKKLSRIKLILRGISSRVKKHKQALFWASVAIMLAFAAYVAILDTRSDLIDCRGQETDRSAFLVINEFDTSAKLLKASILVPTFDRVNDTLEIESVSLGIKKDEADYEKRFSSSPGNQTKTEGVWLSIGLPYTSKAFYYPFERYVVNFHVNFQKNGADVPLTLQVRNEAEGVIAHDCSARYSFEEAAIDTNSFSIVFHRHRFVRLTAVTLYIVAIVFLIYLLKREGIKEVLSNSLGYIAALWGIREIIVGSIKLFPTIVDFVTLGLYTFVVAITIYKWLINPSNSASDDSNEKGHPDDRA